MGEVYRADDLRLGQTVALKFLPANLAADRERLELFHAEVRTARQVTHPNVTRVYDLVDAGGHLSLSMEYVDGEDLATLLRRSGAFDERAGVELLRQLCSGLAAIHDAGVLHRDLKPANIMIDRGGRAHLMDFGLASSSRAGDLKGGTPAYMAPEQLLERRSSVASDLYALGLVLFEIFTGERAVPASVFEQGAAQDAARQTAADHPGLRRVESSIAAAIRACLHRDPARRPASARDVGAMVRTVLIDGHARGRRIAQQLAPMGAAFVTVGALSALGIAPAAYHAWCWGAALAGLIAFGLALRLTLDWNTTYKGHAIHFQNHPVRAERLFIDGRKVASGGMGVRRTLQGTIERGEGAGERITAESVAGPREFRVKVVAERFR